MGLLGITLAAGAFDSSIPPNGLPNALHYGMSVLPELQGVVSLNTLAQVEPVKQRSKMVPQFSKVILGCDPSGAFGAPKQSHTGNEPASATKPVNNRAGTPATSPAADDARKPDTRAVADSAAPMTADQARKTDATAKYYTTDAAAPGPEAREQMTCESPTGQKRIFFLANGKLTSI